MRFSLGFIASAVTAVFAAENQMKNVAIEKVVEMLHGMKNNGASEKQQESVNFAEFQTWCDNTRSEKGINKCLYSS